MDHMRGLGCKCAPAAMMDYLNVIADENRFNPVRDMLARTPWDGQDRVSEALGILGVEENTDSALCMRKWLHQCVAMALNDEANPVGADGVLVLQGPQGAGKTRFFRVLAMRSEWFCEGASINMDDKDSLMRATGAWITELGELDSTFKREQSALKAFVTQAVDQNRPPYGRALIRKPRRTSLAATVNPKDFLRDETGNRRYWVVPVDKIDVEALNALTPEWIQQLWAQVYDFHKDYPGGFRLSEDERERITKRNRAFDKLLPFEQEVRELMDFDMAPDQWQDHSASDVKRRIMGHVSAEQVGRVLRRMADEDERIMARKQKGITRYRLPLRRLC